jgi:DNA-binding beta-propeller fold protein YncE
MKLNKVILVLFSVTVLGCTNTAPPNFNMDNNSIALDNAELSFSSMAIKQSYLTRKFQKLLSEPVNPANLIKELEYGKYKQKELVKSVMDNNPGMLESINAVTEISTRRSLSPSFDDFMVYLDSENIEITFGNVSTFAGGGDPEDGMGDGLLATEAKLGGPYLIAFDSADNLYFTDNHFNSVRRVDKLTGIITTFAGGGNPEDGLGDGLKATEAKINSPDDIAFDSLGNLYISQPDRIRKIDKLTGIITTFAGGGNPEDGLGDGLQATEAKFEEAWGLAFDKDDNLFIADVSSNVSRVRKVNNKTGKITTVAGNGGYDLTGDGGKATEASLSDPWDIVFDKAGNFYIADANNSRIRKVDTNGIITSIAGSGERLCCPVEYTGDGGQATEAVISNVWNIAIDKYDNLYLGAYDHNRIRKINLKTGIITTIAGTGEGSYTGDGGDALQATFHSPCGIAFDKAGNLYVAEDQNAVIRKINKN